ncbi:MAG: NACHT domain-containing protein [Xanthomonadales bacterium]|jgi:hypothetical protein|nr:NACHT domain-containing protein [Xanthomonadales bacterium]
MKKLVSVQVFMSGSEESEVYLSAAQAAFEAFNSGAFASAHRFRFDCRRWKRHVSPAFPKPGDTKQAVVDAQMGKTTDYDVVLAVLHTKLGAGTRSEIDNVRKLRGSPESPFLLIFATHATRETDLDGYLQQISKEEYLKCYIEGDPEEFFRQQVELFCKRKDFLALLKSLAGSPRDILISTMQEFWPQVDSTEWIPLGIAVDSVESVSDSEFLALAAGRRKLLLSGPAGSGKSFLIHRMMHQQLREIAWKKDQQIPVYLTAASFANPEVNFANLDEWLRFELERTYRLGRKTVDVIVRNNLSILLIDGLDALAEISQKKFSTLVSKLADPSRRVVAACRPDLKRYFDGAFDVAEVAPLQPAAVLQNDPELAEMVQKAPRLAEALDRPLIVSLIKRAHKLDRGIARRITGDEANTLDSLIEIVYSAPFDAREAPIGIEQRRSFLSGIARMMQGQGRFFLDRIQPSVELEHGYRLATSLTLLVCIFWLVFLPGMAGLAIERSFSEFPLSLGYCASYACIAALLGASVVALGFLFGKGWVLFSVSISLGFGLARGVIVGASLTDDLSDIRGYWDGVKIALSTSLFFLIISVYFFSRVSGDSPFRWPRRNHGFSPQRIRPLEIVASSFLERSRYFWISLPFGLVIGAGIGWLWGWSRGLAFGISGGLIAGAYAVFSAVPPPATVRPNQAIDMSKRVGLLAAFIFVLVIPSVFAMTYLPLGWPQAITNFVLGMTSAVTVLLFGTLPVIQHYCLRHVIERKLGLPALSFKKALQYCEDRGLLIRAGSAFSFPHDLIQKHFEKSSDLDDRSH